MTSARRPPEDLLPTFLLVVVGLLLMMQGHLHATNDENHIEEVMVGANGNSRIQFIVIREEPVIVPPGGNCWGPQPAVGDPNCAFGVNETQSRVMLVFFDAKGRETGKFKFPTNPLNTTASNIGNVPVLIATQEFANLPGAPTPNFIMPPLLNPIAGKVCFTNNPANLRAFVRNDCLSYGGSGFTGTPGTSEAGVVFGPPAPALPIVNTVSLKRSTAGSGSTQNANFVLTTTPTPKAVISPFTPGPTFTIPVATQTAQGDALFTNEAFLGNGRTCASCHVASQSFGLPPANIQSRFATLASTFDPLFIGELKPSAFDAGFDFNLNTLTLAAPPANASPCNGELRGVITT